MAAVTRAYTLQKPAAGVLVVTWASLDGDDYGTPVKLPYYSDKCVQLGAYGGNTHGGATTVMQGSNDVAADPTHADYATSVWFTLTDPQGNAISRTTSAILEQIQENPLWVRPLQTGGVAADIDVVLVCKGSD